MIFIMKKKLRTENNQQQQQQQQTPPLPLQQQPLPLQNNRRNSNKGQMYRNLRRYTHFMESVKADAPTDEMPCCLLKIEQAEVLNPSRAGWQSTLNLTYHCIHEEEKKEKSKTFEGNAPKKRDAQTEVFKAVYEWWIVNHQVKEYERKKNTRTNRFS